MTNLMIPYGRQSIDEDDIQAVVDVLRSDWLTTGPMVEKFEQAVAQFVGAKYAVAVSSGTAALHCAMYAAEIGAGDEVIVPPMTFVATANAVLFQGGTPVCVDVDEDTLLINPAEVEKKITPKTRAIIAVDYAGQPCDYDALRAMADRHHLILVADACHSLGGEYKGRKVGTLADLTVFSFHPVKHITTGEGGMVVTDSLQYAEKVRIFRNHGITTDHCQRAKENSWHYEMVDLGYNYRLTDFQCALGLSQLRKLPGCIARRQEIAEQYDEAFRATPTVKPLSVREEVLHAYHLYVIRLRQDRLKESRETIFSDLRRQGIGVNVHYIPLHLHPYYVSQYGRKRGDCPVAEKAYEGILSLPMFPGMKTFMVIETIQAIRKVAETYQT
jgi:perosamine synthetase